MMKWLFAFLAAMSAGPAAASTWGWYQASSPASRDTYLVGAADAFRFMIEVKSGETASVCIPENLVANASVAKQVLDAGEARFIRRTGTKVPSRSFSFSSCMTVLRTYSRANGKRSRTAGHRWQKYLV
jgi:hypothetical protein